jgi:hypothetical protein
MNKQIPLNLWGIDQSRRLFVSHPVKKTILEFLGHFPREIQVHGPMVLGPFALQLGKCLAQLSEKFDDKNGPNFHADIDAGEFPDSLAALANQFQIIGRRLIDQRPGQIEAHVALLAARIAELEHHLNPKWEPEIVRGEINVPDFLKLTKFNAARAHSHDLHFYRRGARL